MSFFYFHLFRRTETTGCEYEDGSDTRESDTDFFIVPDNELDAFCEQQASDYGMQDYSYQVRYDEIAKIGYWELNKLEAAIAQARRRI